MLAARVNRIYSSQRTAAPAKSDGLLFCTAGASRGVEHVRRAFEREAGPTANRRRWTCDPFALYT